MLFFNYVNEQERKPDMIPKAIVFDLDGTLLSSDKTISPRTWDALQAVKALGIALIFATARPPRAVSWNLDPLGTSVYYNGALFHCAATKRDIHFSIPQHVTARVIEYSLALDPEARISVEVKDRWYSHQSYDYMEMMKVKTNPEVISLEQLMRLDATKILISHCGYAEHLVRGFNADLNIVVTDGGQLLQAMSNEASKENAVRYLTNQLGIGMVEIWCFGDDFNDLGLFQTCGRSIAMGNAVEELKQIASEITDTNDNDGVAVILEKMMKAASSLA